MSTTYSRNDDADMPAASAKKLCRSEPSDILYFGNLNYDTDLDELMKFISEFGLYPARGRMTIDKETGKQKGSAFVQMTTYEDAAQAIELLNNEEYLGRQLTVRYKTVFT